MEILVREYLKSVRDLYEEWLERFVNIPTVSADDSHRKEMLLCAEQAKILLTLCGFRSTVVMGSERPLAVIGEFIRDERLPTLMLYGHLDVQPADPSEWKSPPFSFREEKGTYFGRGATDDKGPSLALLFAALYAIQTDFPLNFQILLDLEEEVGNPNFEAMLSQNPFHHSPDAILSVDGLWTSKDQPTGGYTLRGSLSFSLSLETAVKDVHSGIVGGVARDPILELSEALAACCDSYGHVKIPGFYDAVQKPNDDEVGLLLEQTGFSLDRFRETYGLRLTRNMTDEEAIRVLTMSPAFIVLSFHGGHAGIGYKNVVPHRAEAKVNIRLVSNQDPREVMRLVSEFIKSLNPDIKIEPKKNYVLPFIANTKTPYHDALGRAVKKVLGRELIFKRSGGSIGAIPLLERHYRVPIVIFGISLPEHGYHAPNEYFEWQQASRGMEILIEYFREIANPR